MTKEERREDITNRHQQVIAERVAFCVYDEENWNTLTKLAKLIRSEYENGNKNRHVMRLVGGKYDWTVENINRGKKK